MLDGDLLRVFHQALARLNFVTEVTEDHVREAVRLVEASKVRHAGTRQRTRHAGGNKREGSVFWGPLSGARLDSVCMSGWVFCLVAGAPAGFHRDC